MRPLLVLGLMLALYLPVTSYGQPYRFPLKVSENRRYLSDQEGRPFLYVSDAAWSLFIGFTVAEAREYFLERKRQGFSAIQVQLTYFPGETARNPEGQLPFDAYDFARPNDRYFDHAGRIIALADSLNLLMVVAPLWYSCCNDGWGSNPAQYMKQNGVGKCEGFGRYVGQRFGQYPNLVWIMGGDNDPWGNEAEVQALALGLKAAAPHHLITYHAASTHSSTDVWPDAPWLDFSMVYTYFRGFSKAWNRVQPDVYEVCHTEYRKAPAMPFILGESNYEGEHTELSNTALQARKQAWYTLLSGGCGHAYGSRFWVAGYQRPPGDPAWRAILTQDGAESLIHLNTLFARFDWTRLVPDLSGAFLNSNVGYAKNDFAVAALTHDRKIALAYLPSGRTLRPDLRLMAGKKVRAGWYNPRTGGFASPVVFKVTQPAELTPPDTLDWVLFLESL